MNRNDRKIAVAALVVLTLALVGFYIGGSEEWQTPMKEAGGTGITGTTGAYGSAGGNHTVQSSKFKVQSSKFKVHSSKFKVQSTT